MSTLQHWLLMTYGAHRSGFSSLQGRDGFSSRLQRAARLLPIPTLSRANTLTFSPTPALPFAIAGLPQRGIAPQ